MDHAAAQPADPLQRERHVGHGEIRQRCRVSRPGAARVDPDRGPLTAGLTAGALPLEALLEAVVEQPFPEAARPLGVSAGNSISDKRAPGTAQSYRCIERNQRMSTPGRPGPEELPDGTGMPCSSSRCRAACGRRPTMPRRSSRLARHGGPRTGEVLRRLERHGWTLVLPDPGRLNAE
jgi:hypothetical protein